MKEAKKMKCYKRLIFKQFAQVSGLCRPQFLSYLHLCIGVRAIFGQGGGGVNHLPKKFMQVAQIFTKQSKRNEGHTMQQHRPSWHMKVPRYSFSGSIPAKFEHKLRRHKQTFGKIATTVVLDKDENLS